MLAEAARQARRRNVRNVHWRQLRAEELPADLPAVRVATFAQSLHWMDRGHVLVRVRAMLEPNGAAVHVHATTHQGIDTDVQLPYPQLPYPQPPREQITQLVHRYLGPQRRAGQGVLTPGTSETEEVIYRAAGFTGPERFEVPGRTVQRTVEEIVASVYSLSSASPHLFGDRLEQFDTELRGLLVQTAENGCFSEQMRSITLDIWR